MNLIAIDTETHLFPPEGKVRSEHHVPDMVCITWCRRAEPSEMVFPGRYEETRETGLIMWDDPDGLKKLLELIDDDDTVVVMQNGRFDFAVLSKWRPSLKGALMDVVDSGRFLDTRVMHHLRYPLKDRLHSLAAIVKHLFNETLDKGSVRTSFRRGQILSAQQKEYAKEDAYWTWKAANKMLTIPYGALAREEQEFLVAADNLYDGMEPDYLYSSALAYLAWFLEPEGLRVNMPVVNEKYAELEKNERILSIELYEAGLMRAVRQPGVPTRVEDMPTQDKKWTVRNLNPLVMHHRAGSQAKGYYVETIPGKWVLNTAALREAFLEQGKKLSLQIPLTDTGQVSTEYDFWKEYNEDLPEPLCKYLELSKVRKYKSAFVGPLANQRPLSVYPYYAIPGCETGRWSCYRPNIQQQPKRLRPMYGGRMCGADYKSLECFTLAHAMACLGIRGNMLHTLGQKDIHTHVAQECGVKRQEAKVATFGLGGGMGFRRFYQYMRYQCGLPVTYDEACQVRMRWLMYFRDVAAYLELFKFNHYDLCPQGMKRREWLDNLGFDTNDTWPSNFALSQKLGGKITCVLPSGRVIPQRNYSQAANVFFQGTGADVMTQAFVDLCKARVRTLAVVHDSAYVYDLCHGPILTQIMEGALKAVCPTVVQVVTTPEYEVKESFF